MSAIKTWYTNAEIEDELERLTNLLMRSNMRYLLREARLLSEHQEDPNLMRILETDKALSNHSGAAKTVATLLAGLKAALDVRKAH